MPTVCPLFTFAPRRGYGRATGRPYDPRQMTPRHGGIALMRRSYIRVCGLLLAALALPVLAIGPATAATKTPTTTTLKLQSTSLNGDGSTFQNGFNDVAIGDFKQLQKARDDQLPGRRLRSGSYRLHEQGRRLRRHGRSVRRRRLPRPSAVPLLPDGRRPDHRLVQPVRRDEPEALGRHHRQDLPGADHDLGRPGDQGRQPGRQAARARRSRWRTGRTAPGRPQNFTNFLTKAAPTTWTLGTGIDRQAGRRARRAASGNAGVAQIVKSTDGAIGYVDFSDAEAGDLTFAAIKNAAGKYIAPSTKSASAAVGGATVNPDLTYDPINAAGADGLPDHVADLDHRVHDPDRRQRRAPRSRRS